MIGKILVSIIDGFFLGTIYAIAALGLSLIFGVLDYVDFAQGSFLMLGMYASYWSYTLFGLTPILSLLLTVPLFFLIGLLYYRGLVKRVIEDPPVSQIVLSLGVMMGIQGVALVMWGSQPRAVPSALFPGAFTVLGHSVPLTHVIIAIFSFGAFLFVLYLLHKTWFGLAIRAAVDDRDAATSLGIDEKKLFMLSMGLGVALAAFSGSLLMTFSQVSPVSGLRYIILMWIIVVISGLGTVRGVLFSGWMIGIAQSSAIMFWSYRASLIIVFIVFIIVLWVKPRGLWGVR